MASDYNPINLTKSSEPNERVRCIGTNARLSIGCRYDGVRLRDCRWHNSVVEYVSGFCPRAENCLSDYLDDLIRPKIGGEQRRSQLFWLHLRPTLEIPRTGATCCTNSI